MATPKGKRAPAQGGRQRKLLLFPDANRLLEFYEGTPLTMLDDLAALEGCLLLTAQVRDEVERSKCRVVDAVVSSVREPIRGPRLHWVRSFDELDSAYKAHQRAFARVHAELKEWAAQVKRSEDPTSQALSRILKGAVVESESQYERARRRHERGNPPGKKGDPLGDQISWEQLLDAVGPGTERVWVVTADGDFGGDGVLHAVMNRELKDRAPNATVTLTTDLAGAVNSCLEAMGEERRISEAAREAYQKSQEEFRSQLLEVGSRLATVAMSAGLLLMLKDPNHQEQAMEMMQGPAFRSMLETMTRADNGVGGARPLALPAPRGDAAAPARARTGTPAKVPRNVGRDDDGS